MFKHGIFTSENPTPIEGVKASQAQVIVGTAPVNRSSQGDVINRPFLCHSFEEAKALLGYSEDYEKYTLCEAMDVNFNFIGVGPVIFINVLNPKVHKKSGSADVTLVNDKGIINNESVLLESVVVKSADEQTTYTRDTDYIVGFNGINQVVITKMSSGSMSVDRLKVSFDELDPGAVTSADIIGSLDQATGKRTGLELLRLVYPTLKAIAKRIIIPKYSKEEQVRAAMVAVCKNINGCFNATLLFDLKGDKDAEAMTDKEASAYSVSEAVAVWPMVKVNKKKVHLSTLWSAMIAYNTATNGDFPSKHSNIILDIEAVVNSKGDEIFMDVPMGNELNKKGIVTVVHMNGMRLWGNHTAAYPERQDPKDVLINVKHIFIHEQNRFITEYYDKVDNPMNPKLIESIVDSENMRYNALKMQNKIGDGRVVFNLSENTNAIIEKRGSLLLRQILSPFEPAAGIENVFSFSPYELGGAKVGK